MSKTLVIGAHGQIGQLLIRQLVAQQQPVVAMIRDQQQATDMQALGAQIMIADLEQPLADEVFNDIDKVVFTAGSGGNTGADKTILVDLWGACTAIDAANKHGIKQFVMVSSRHAGDPDAGSDKLKYYNVAKHFADQHLLQSGLPYTILRPGRLTNEPATGYITISRPENQHEQSIAREDVASCIAHCLTHSNTINKIYQLYSGTDQIEVALQ